MNLLFIGDIVGRSGRRAVRERLAALRDAKHADFVVVNAENAADGLGLNKATMEELFQAGADVLTLGDHAWDKRDIIPLLETETRLLRPGNYPPGVPGRGSGVFTTASGLKIGVLCAQGRTFMIKQILEDPFRWAKEEAERLRAQTTILVVDFHAEATSEKCAIGRHLDGLVSAVLGTHTHVQTADERILPKGTAFICDAGMTGPRDSVIGFKPDSVLARFTTQMSPRLEVAEGAVEMCGALVSIDDKTGQAESIERVREIVEAA